MRDEQSARRPSREEVMALSDDEIALALRRGARDVGTSAVGPLLTRSVRLLGYDALSPSAALRFCEVLRTIDVGDADGPTTDAPARG